MTRLKALGGVLIALALLTGPGFAAPAQADSPPPANCDATWPPLKPVFTFHFSGTVYYGSAGGTETINALGFRFFGAHTGGKSDSDYTIKENGAVRLSGHTPDNIQADELRIVGVSTAVAAASVAQADFHPAFDIFGPDPHCNATTTW